MRYTLAKIFHGYGSSINNESEKIVASKCDEYSQEHLVSTKLSFQSSHAHTNMGKINELSKAKYLYFGVWETEVSPLDSTEYV